MTPEIFTSLSFHDLALYYNQSYLRVKLPEKKDFEWVYLREFGAFTTHQSEVILQAEDKVSKTFPIKAITWDFNVPESGVYNFKNSAILFCRKPIRHTSKGLNYRNVHYTNILYTAAQCGAIPEAFFVANNFELNPMGLNLLFERNSPPSYEKGIERILKKQALAYALDSRICLTQGLFSLNPSIFLKDRIIGELDAKRGEVIPLHSAFVTELTQSFGHTGLRIRN